MESGYKKFPFEERTLFLTGLTFVGGYINTYAFIARGGSFVSFHTGNLVRLSMAAAEYNMPLFFKHLIPVLMCILGGCIAEIMRIFIKKSDWRFYVLMAEAFYLILLGILPHSADKFLNYSLSVLAGAHFYLFRSWEGMPYNVSASTGNTRSFAVCFTDSWVMKKAEMMRFLRYTVLFLSFPIGAFIGAVISNNINEFASWPVALLLVIWAFMYRKNVKVRS